MATTIWREPRYTKRKKPPATETRQQIVRRQVVRAGNFASRRKDHLMALPSADSLLAAVKQPNTQEDDQ